MQKKLILKAPVSWGYLLLSILEVATIPIQSGSLQSGCAQPNGMLC